MKLEADAVSWSYGMRPLLRAISFQVAHGKLVGLIGPNGVGKSTLLRCLYGSMRPQSGSVRIDGRDVASLSRRAIARVIGVVPQSSHPAFPLSVREFVGMGRFAHEPLLRGPSPSDQAVVRASLDQLGLLQLAGTSIDALSGGEFRRVLIAQALAQEPSLLLLDEPVQQLDPRQQLEVLEFARRFAHEPGHAALVVLHDLTLAARFCDELLLLHDGHLLASGAPEAVLTADHLRTAYGIEAAIERCDATQRLQVVALAAAHLSR